MEEMSNPARIWLSTFRLMNLELRLQLDSRPLYCYQVTYSEFQDLELMLQKHKLQVFHGSDVEDWAACFCLYVAEVFRREYDAHEGGWSWELVWSRLGYNFPTLQYQQIVEIGMLKWRRPIRKTQHGRSFLGSLFSEGGLPWRLVQSEQGVITMDHLIKRKNGIGSVSEKGPLFKMKPALLGHLFSEPVEYKLV